MSVIDKSIYTQLHMSKLYSPWLHSYIALFFNTECCFITFSDGGQPRLLNLLLLLTTLRQGRPGTVCLL